MFENVTNHLLYRLYNLYFLMVNHNQFSNLVGLFCLTEFIKNLDNDIIVLTILS